MKRSTALCAALLLIAALAACTGLNRISSEDVAAAPTVHAKVVKEPNPLLFGHWRRPQPAGINKPWIFNYWMVKRGDKVAVYYFYDSRRKNSFKGWADFTINGDSMTSGVDGNTFYVQNGRVFMKVAGRDTPYEMEKID
ncbi:MAG: hypothetical protein ACOZEN_08325 [Thermodesulfobacteriota bacterium]